MAARRQTPDPRLLAFVTFTATLFIQLFHETEHVLQIYQKHAWHWQLYPGLLGRWFDLEWVHMLYNGALWFALLATWITQRKNPGMWRTSALGASALKFVVIFQGYHWCEHLVRMVQYAAGDPRPRGVAGYIIPVLELHFILGSIVTAGMVLAYLLLRPWPALRPRARTVSAQTG